MSPVRTVTTTVCVTGGKFPSRITVKTRADIPKEKIFACIRALKGIQDISSCTYRTAILTTWRKHAWTSLPQNSGRPVNFGKTPVSIDIVRCNVYHQGMVVLVYRERFLLVHRHYVLYKGEAL